MLQNDENPLSKWMVKLTDAQRQRTFSIERIPADPNHRRCLVCGNSTINEPVENQAVTKHNQEVDKNYSMKIAVWNEYLKSCEGNAGKDSKKIAFPTDPTNPTKTIRRTPAKSAYKSQVLQCMASTSKCVMRNSNTCSTCPIWCTNEETGLRYPFEDKCQCPVCQSTCTAAYYVHNFHQLSINIAMLTNQKQAGLADTPNDRKQKLGGFLGSMISSGMQTVFAMQSKQEKKQMKMNNYYKVVDSKRAKTDEQYKAQEIENAFFKSAALNITKQGPSALLYKDRNKIGHILGTDTVVQLPKEGAQLDTKTLGGTNKHAYNNRLVVDASVGKVVTPIQPGMVSRYHIDYSPPHSKEFTTASAGMQLEEESVG